MKPNIFEMLPFMKFSLSPTGAHRALPISGIQWLPLKMMRRRWRERGRKQQLTWRITQILLNTNFGPKFLTNRTQSGRRSPSCRQGLNHILSWLLTKQQQLIMTWNWKIQLDRIKFYWGGGILVLTQEIPFLVVETYARGCRWRWTGGEASAGQASLHTATLPHYCYTVQHNRQASLRTATQCTAVEHTALAHFHTTQRTKQASMHTALQQV